MKTERKAGAGTMRFTVWRLLVIGTIAWMGTNRPAAVAPPSAAAGALVVDVHEPAPDDACGGWRPRRPMMCTITVLATAIAGGLMSTIPAGGVVAFVAMAPLLLETCG